MYFLKIKYSAEEQWSFLNIEINAIEETKSSFIFNYDDLETLPCYCRNEIVYKNDDDVISCGYNVLDHIYLSYDYYDETISCSCFTFNIEKSKLKMINEIKELIKNKVNYYNNILESIENEYKL